jgi:hypothetical protein
VTDQADQIQSMLHDLDRTLRQTGHWRLWNVFTRLSQQRQMLERVRNFLMMQASSSQSKPLNPPRRSQPPSPSLGHPVPPPHLHPEAIKLELVALNAQRDALREEVKFLEQRKELSVIDARQVEQLKALNDRTDFLLSSMDSSLQLAFGSMQKNVEIYQTSLHQGIDRMHSLGYQGEVLVSALVNQLAQHLERELGHQPNPASQPVEVTTTSKALTSEPLPSQTLPSQTLTEPAPTEPAPTEPAHLTVHRATPLLDPNPATTNPATLQPETAVRFSADSLVLDLDITLDNLFGDSDNNSDNNSKSNSESNSNQETTDPVAYDEITLEEMNQLFADVPALRV